MTVEEKKQQRKSSNRLRILAYSLLVVFRVFLCPFLPGYVHPDEFFQGGQELWFSCSSFTPWEFEPENALRSVLPPTIMTWLPLRIYSFLANRALNTLSGREILIIPRIVCGLLSVVTVDVAVWKMTAIKERERVPSASVLVLASAWPSLVLLNRPFSNALETMLLELLLLITTALQQGYLTDALSGIVCALGLFTRFTFVFCAIPTMLRYLMEKLTPFPISSRAILGLVIMAMSFFVTAVTIVYVDVSFYKATSDAWTSFVTPLNALLYNSQVQNLQEHGLHPRWTHAVLNMLLLYGPLAIMFYITLGNRVLSFLRRTTSESRREDISMETTRIRSTCLWTVVSGLGFLSLAPHQEPRFLLPLLVPLAVLSQPYWESAWVRLVWVVFNAILLIVYGGLHQGGIIPSLLDVSTIIANAEGHAPRAVLYHHTYMPPTFASRTIAVTPESRPSFDSSVEQDSDSCSEAETLGCGVIPIIDLKGSSVENLLSALNDHLLCGERDEGDSDGRIYLVSPPLSTDMGNVVIGADNCQLGPSYICRHVQSYRPHLTTEDFPPLDDSIWSFLANFELGIYQVACV